METRGAIRRLMCTMLVMAMVGLSWGEVAYANERDCVVNQETGQKVCRESGSPQPSNNVTVTVIGVGLVVGVTFMVLWATRPLRSRKGAGVRRAELPAPPPVDVWATEDSGGLSVQWRF